MNFQIQNRKILNLSPNKHRNNETFEFLNTMSIFSNPKEIIRIISETLTSIHEHMRNWHILLTRVESFRKLKR